MIPSPGLNPDRERGDIRSTVDGAPGRRGLLVTFEGVEGSGKSTQMELLADWLRGEGWDVETAREPGTTTTGEAVRRFLLETAPGELDPHAELALFLAARAQLVVEVVGPALEEGKIVLVDRYGDSSVAYQGHGRGIDPDRIAELNSWVTGGVEPDLTVLIDVPVDEGVERRGDREPDRLERLDEAFHERVRRGYRRIAGNQQGRFCVIEGRQSIQAIQQTIRDRVRGLLAGRTPQRTAIR